MNILELDLMETFDFSLFITEQEFMNYLSRLEGYREINS
jgi:hypothetical protein